MIKFIRIHTLKCRGPVEGEPDREVEGVLLSTENPVLAFDAGHRDTGHDHCELWPAFHNGAQCWILTRDWRAASGYSAWGVASSILPLEEGIRILIDRSVFRIDPPKTSADELPYIVGRLHATSEPAPDVRAVPMRLVVESTFQELLAVFGRENQ